MIARAGQAHAAALATIHAAAFPPGEAWSANSIALLLGQLGGFGLIDERGGMVLARVAADQAEVLTLAVTPAARRQGIAAGLLRLACAEAGGRGATSVFLEVHTDNVAALALYRREGFIEVGRRRRFYADSSDALVLRMTVT